MSLSNDLLSQFVKVNTDNVKPKTETTVYGTTVEYNGRTYVRLDGSDLLTPVESTVATVPGERVTVMIKDHTATVTGNLSSPSARRDDVDALGSQISEFEIVLAYKIQTDELSAINAAIDNLKATIAKFEDMEAINADIETLRAKYATLENVTAEDVKALNAEIENLEAKFGDFTHISAEDMQVINAEIQNLRSYNANFTYVSAEVLSAINATIKNLNASYANIDFANIGEAAIRKIFADSGLIRDIIVGDGTITGELVGVTIKGDLIEGNTIKADKLVVKGSDGLYYKLNFESGNFTDAEEVPTEGLHGSVILAKSVTADRIAVTDLVAFGATIGGFKIGSHSLHSGVKESVDNTTEGVYLDSTGQVAFGDAYNFLKLYKDSENAWKLAISADSLLFGSTKKSVEDVDAAAGNAQTAANDAQSAANDAVGRVAISESAIQQLADSIASLVTDENGTSLMTQTSTGWTFNMAAINETLNSTSKTLSDLSGKVDGVDTVVDRLNTLANDISQKTAYITMATDSNGSPCIELGKADNDFKVRITNTSVDFMEGSSRIAYVSNRSLYIEKAIIKDELQIGEGTGFIWKRRSNGNLGLRWIGG